MPTLNHAIMSNSALRPLRLTSAFFAVKKRFDLHEIIIDN
jgi:hypothetical protein